MKIGFSLDGFDQFRALLGELPASVEARVMGDAVGFAAKPIVAAAKAKAPMRTGALRRSLTSIVKRYPGQGKVTAIIGPDKDYYSAGLRVKKGKSWQGADRPAKYAHLVEFGYFSGVSSDKFGGFKKGTSIRKGTATATAWISPKPFLRPAVAAASAAASANLAEGVRVGMDREIKRIESKTRRLRKSVT